MDFRIKISVYLFLLILEQHLMNKVNGACTWPMEFLSSQWHDSSRGILTFSTQTMQGWAFSPTATTEVSSWECVSVSTYNTEGRMILITSDSFRVFSTNNYAYLCITITKVTDNSYSYYINHEIQANLNYERLFVYPVGTLTDHGTICSNGASGGEYQMLIKEGSESSAKVDCPWHFLGRYGYIHTTSGGTTSCEQDNSEINMCTDTQEMRFDYNSCPTKVAKSVSDVVWCVGNVVDGDTNYVMIYNGNDADNLIDYQSIFRFTCMAVSADVTTASVSPRYCRNGQVPDKFPKTPVGLPTGALLSLSSAIETCQCDEGRWGENCTRSCFTCKNESCDSISGSCNGHCKPGLKLTEFCDQECDDGWYGLNCSEKCSTNCKEDSVCRKVDGSCLECKSGLQGKHCEIGLEQMKDSSINISEAGVAGIVIAFFILITISVVVTFFVTRKRFIKHNLSESATVSFSKVLAAENSTEDVSNVYETTNRKSGTEHIYG